jgi:aldos-2-ulose dehydratase/isomerase family protein/VCBS repeat protein
MTSGRPVRRLLSVVLVALAATLLRAGAQTPAAGAGGGVEFVAHTIGTELRGGYQVVVADLNKDGKPDVIAVAQALPDLVWYENPGWQRHVIASGMAQMINAAAYDIDGDGIPEIALAQGFTTSTKTSTGIVSILTHGADPAAPWTVKEIDRVPTAHRLRWIDADGTGKKVLMLAPLIGPDSAAPDYKSPVSIFFYRAPDWKREVVTDTFTGLIHGIEPEPWPGVRGQVVLSAGFMGIYLHRFGGGKWTPTELIKGDPDPWPKSGASDIAVGHLGAQRFIATIEPWHGNQIVIYKEAGGGWQRQPIDDSIADGHAIIALDAAGDGRDQVVVGQRGGARSLMLYSPSADGATWARRVVDEGGMAGAGCAAADLNGDRRMDIVCIGTATANLKWYENAGKK